MTVYRISHSCRRPWTASSPVLFTTLASLALLAFQMTVPRAAAAEPNTPPPPPAYEDLGTEEDSPVDWTVYPKYREKRGLFMRIAVGPGAFWGWQEVNGSDLTLSGPGISLDFSIGGFVLPNLAIGADLSTANYPAPSAELDGRDLGDNADINFGVFYFAINYYFMPVNMYVSLAGGMANEIETDFGPAAKVTIGKEWDVARNWDIGFALRAEYMSLSNGQDQAGDDVTFNALNLGLVFSASFNLF